MDESNTRRIVLLGKTGTGKSSLANTIFGEELFKTGNNPNSETSRCEAQTRTVNRRSLTLIDTPGFFDTRQDNKKEDNLKPEILRCITECAPGPHAFLIVLEVGKFTEHEKAVINKITEYFSEEAFKYAVVVFTHGDQLNQEQKIEDFFNQNTSLKSLVEKCGNRCHVIDNKYWNRDVQDQYRNNQFQVKELLKTIDEIMLKNQGRYYTNEMLQAVQEEIRQEVEKIRKSFRNVSAEEIRRKAKDSVFHRFLIRAAGVATGALIGALCGVAAVVGAVCVVLIACTKIPLVKEALKLTAGAVAAAAEGAAVAGTAAAGAAAAAEGAAVAGTAAAGEAAVAAGGTAAAGAAGTALASVTIAAAVTGAVAGGVRGYYATEEAETPWQAAKMTAGAIKDDALYVYDSTLKFLDRISRPQSKQDGKPK